MSSNISRRSLLSLGVFGVGNGFRKKVPTTTQIRGVGGLTTMGEVNHEKNGFDPYKLLTDWDTGKVSKLSNGQQLREYEITAIEREIEIAPGVFYPAWTYNGRIPGPTLRVTQGDRIRIKFKNLGSHLHTIHFHGIHAAQQDGIPGVLEAATNQEIVYEFNAEPFGCHLSKWAELIV
ncbi:multicopper oxidase domain-containing protein [Geminocystis sp. NIES-3709]|uniref:multicopper oxidase domain-containing protein n=1 Tax=Geminocystis sp. NIES-3709 TaxID=1617448 RepID=UPI0005FC4949|nr:multicopper oxidase domain-containing protein [Geminocystis sp. NIES-3709]BAQ66361.1 multicopper oxidase [Geminocystis sp. NIES-3709]